MKPLLGLLIFLVYSGSLWGADNASALFSTSQLPSVSAQGKAGATVASLSKSCQKLINSPLTAVAQQVLPQYFIATSPVIPFVGFTIGLVQYDSVIMQTCNLLINLDRVNTQSGILMTGNYLNQLTANKFDNELNTVDSVFNLSNSLYDFTSGAFRQGSLTNANNHQKALNLMDNITKVYNKRTKNKNEGLETKSQRRAELEAVTRASYKRAIIEEATTCPSPQGNKDFVKQWQDYVPQREDRVKEETIKADYYYDTFTKMGPDFITDTAELQEYLNLLNTLRHNSIRYRTTTGTYSEDDTEITSQLDKQGYPKKKKVKKTRGINLFTAAIDSQVVNAFRTKFSKKWEAYIKGEVLSAGLFGLMDDKKGRIEAKYRNYAFECSEIQLSRTIGLNPSDPAYYNLLNQEQIKCRNRLNVRENEMQSLFENYLNRLALSLTVSARNQVEVWNFEAQKMGYNREISTSELSGAPGNYQQTKISCSNKLEISELKRLSVENKKINNELKETWAKAKIQNNLIKQEKEKNTSKVINEAAKKNRSAITQGENSGGQKAPMSVDPRARPIGL